jgi:hypothetical protein
MDKKNETLIEWYDGLGGDLNAFTRSPDGAIPEEPSHQMEIEIRPKEQDDDNEIKKIERQAEYQKALAFAKAVTIRLERLSVEEKDEETANKCKKEIEILTKKLLEVMNGKHTDRKETGRDNKSDEKSDKHAG